MKVSVARRDLSVVLPFFVLMIAMVIGCDLSTSEGPQVSEGGSPEQSPVTEPVTETDPQSRPAIKTTRLTSGGPDRQRVRDPQSMSESDAVASIRSVLEEYSNGQDVVVVWLFDGAASSRPLVSAAAGDVRTWYDQADQPESLSTVVATYHSDVEYLVEVPTSDSKEIEASLAGIKSSGDGPGETMRAVEQVLERYRSEREDQGKLVIVALVTGNAGADWKQAEGVASLSRELTSPIFCIGYAAPFGRRSVGGMRRTSDATPVGPETPDLEFVTFDLAGAQGGSLLMDSGFGPWGLEYICRAAGGSYLAIRPKASKMMMASVFDESWPSDQAARFDSVAMARYAPQYIPIAQYETMISDNAALSSLARVADEYEKISVLQSPSVQFSTDNEAQMKRDLDAAQQPAALLSPTVNKVYDILKDGEDDRAKLTQPRWQAAYDLALGQALANVVRVDGYNGMLAQLKTGKEFTNKDSDVWVLEGADTISTSSLMRSKLERARELLQGVIDNHPGTPWAFVAEQELRTPIGYEWQELDTGN